ncbi:RES family NAD+ phosphorylase [Knoellia koreensis]|uniref:RES family NAD+ phosphorylase n=1 Tax=Knoellia koreensis TaxID=2730921 RepID=A0A849HAQ8_9MICO|nr:RES family NAD+ phosphorylase [Knoellia sp. DB2414S]NNM45005.1 RES family NAD+ phosphorylase [Knoellia sp. DB2414S]
MLPGGLPEVGERERVAHRAPQGSLEGFPVAEVHAEDDLFRCHRADRGAWWFGNDGGGRFDLPSPRGTCYLALDAESAVRERLGPVLAVRRELPESALEDAIVSRLHAPSAWRLADVQSRAAGGFGVTRELETMVPYAVPQAWARAFADVGLDGVRYGPRFTPGEASSVAAFGDEGGRDWPTDAGAVPAASVPGIPDLVAAPRRSDLTVVRPPRTRAHRS